MLQTLVSTANFIQILVYYVLYASFSTGKVLVTSLWVLSEKVLLGLKGFVVFLGVLRESLSAFLQDVFKGVHVVATAADHIFNTILEVIWTTVVSVGDAVYSVYLALLAVRDAVHLIITSVFSCLAHGAIFAKKLFVLFGSGIWFSVTLIPLSIFCFIDTSIAYIRLGEEVVWQSCKDFYIFITDIPIESIFGLFIAASFIYIFTKFYIFVFSEMTAYCYQRYLYIKYKVAFIARRIFSHEPTEERIVSPLQRRGAIRRRDDARRPIIESRRQISRESRTSRLERTTYDVPEDRCCVICQERLKCVVLLPCKHLCLCSTCVQRLKRYDDKCPVCRNNIDSDMRIFV